MNDSLAQAYPFLLTFLFSNYFVHHYISSYFHRTLTCSPGPESRPSTDSANGQLRRKYSMIVRMFDENKFDIQFTGDYGGGFQLWYTIIVSHIRILSSEIGALQIQRGQQEVLD